MTTEPTTHTPLYDAMCENPTDPMRKLVYADWLEENGEVDLAHAYRWAAREGKHPEVVRGFWTCFWNHGLHVTAPFSVLPKPLFDACCYQCWNDSISVCPARDVDVAFRWLAAALKELGIS